VSLRVALIGGAAGLRDDLATGLAGHGAEAIALDLASARLGALERLLGRRGFTASLPEVPLAARALNAGHHDLAHALSPAAARGALLWRRRSGRPVVFTCTEVLDRPALSDRRLRLDLLAAAVERSDAVTVATEEGREALWRWMAVEAQVLAPGDGAGHAALYARLVPG
jgi:hypothetical protein